ncbi:unnamed protein product [Coffea canephora]|uniref:Uncharacterized protein n=1 Tax=Coffea canephora TaxID=49390 RepID=A0A068UNG4_COFCA|nr:unnamed protein product [Coffea canephora]
MTRNKPEFQAHPPRTRRLSSCHLHPADPATGICASCLRERLCGLDSSADLLEPSSSAAVIPSLGNGDLAGAGPVNCLNKAAAATSSPELRRCRSVFTAKCEASTSFAEPRRRSCDVRAQNVKSLAHLFDVDDECSNGSNRESKVESKNITTAAAAEFGEEIKVENAGGNRDPHVAFNGDEEEEKEDDLEDGEVKTMKEHIDLELQSKGQRSKDFKELAGNIREAASVFSKKLQKWRQKQKKKVLYGNDGGTVGGINCEVHGPKGKKLEETQSVAADYAMGRRSCDTEPRFSVDAGRLSVEGGRISIDEPRASWDGYLIARTIPRLAPMLSVVDNAILSGGNRIDHHRVSVDGQMHSIMEDETSSGGSAQSNSDSSSSQRRSSFDRSSSVRSFGKKMVVLDGDYAKASPGRLVITERELKDWHLNSIKDDHNKKFESSSRENSPALEDRSNLVSKKPVRWRRVLNVLGFKQKSCENKFEKPMGDCSPAQACEKQEKEAGEDIKAATHWKLMRSSSIVGARRSCEVIRSSNGMMSLGDDSDWANRSREEFVLGRNHRATYASSNLDDGVLPFYLTPLRTSWNGKSRRDKLQDSHFVDGSLLRLN